MGVVRGPWLRRVRRVSIPESGALAGNISSADVRASGRPAEWLHLHRSGRRSSSFSRVFFSQPMFSNIPNEPELAALALACFQCALITAKVQTPALDPAGSEAAARCSFNSRLPNPGQLSPLRCLVGAAQVHGERVHALGERVAPRLSSYAIL